MTEGRFVAYYRVSTDRQGRSGLGLEAQQDAVRRYLNGSGLEVIEEVVEVESGKRDDRPGLDKALGLCRAHRAKLIIAKLDRLARNVEFTARILNSGVEFVAVDNPHANKLTIHILAAMAEHEREQISTRTKAALTQARARGRQLGGDRGNLTADLRTAGNTASADARRKGAADHARDLLPVIERLRAAGITSDRGLARALNAETVPTPSGRGQWQAVTVQRLLARVQA
jgi:DNA invertase Pin-like site-specific DNA recombinase